MSEICNKIVDSKIVTEEDARVEEIRQRNRKELADIREKLWDATDDEFHLLVDRWNAAKSIEMLYGQ